MSGRRIKSTILSAGIALSGLTLIAWTQTWFVIGLVPSEQGGEALPIGGDIAAGGLAALGLAGIALVGALTIAGPAFRLILGVLESLIGATVTLSSVISLADPTAASAAAITDATGQSGRDSVAALVRSIGVPFWPWCAVVLGVATIVLGVLIIVTGRGWPGSSRKYQAVVVDAADDGFDADEGTADDTAATDARADSVADWDAMSDGSDPTSR